MDEHMKILLISYGDYEYDGRLRSLISIFSKLGNITVFCRNSGKEREEGIFSCNFTYRKFIKKTVSFAKKLGEIDVLVLDNRKATIPGLLIINKIHPKVVIQDSRELYLLRESKRFSTKIGCIFEKILARKADIVICANQERAEIMQKEFKLTSVPLVYENKRILEYGSREDVEKAKELIDSYVDKDYVRIISSSGCSISRTNDILVKNLINVEKKCMLFLVGESDKKDEAEIKKISDDDKRDKVIILGKLNQTALKYLISKCHIGIVNYGQYDTNNKLCASGKLYEFLYEGIPVVTTTNPPLKRMCTRETIGVSDDNYYIGINQIIKEYDKYKQAVNVFVSNNTIVEYDKAFRRQIAHIIKNKIELRY